MGNHQNLPSQDRPVARGGREGRTTPPPQLPIPKILFHPLAILFHPLAILFHPSAILFHPWNMWMTSHGQCPRGGGACECPRVGAFFKLMTSRGQCPRGGAPGVPPIQVQTPPPTWLAGYGPAGVIPIGFLVGAACPFPTLMVVCCTTISSGPMGCILHQLNF